MAALFVAGAVVAVIAIDAAYRSLDHPPSDLWLGIMIGLAAASVPWAVYTVVIQGDGSGSWRTGESGELATAAELKKLGRAWSTFHNVLIADPRGGPDTEIDHLAVGPAGVFVIETKVRTGPIEFGADPLPRELSEPLPGLEWRARRVADLLRPKFGRIEVRRLLVCWGPDLVPPPDLVREERGVLIVRGRDAPRWRALLGDPNLTPEQVREIAKRVDAHMEVIESRDQRSVEAIARSERRSERASALAAGSLGLTTGLGMAIVIGLVWSAADRVLGSVLGFGDAAVFGLLHSAALGLSIGSLVSAHGAGRPRRDHFWLPIASLAAWSLGTALLVLLAD